VEIKRQKIEYGSYRKAIAKFKPADGDDGPSSMNEFSSINKSKVPFGDKTLDSINKNN
jgi:hypothetical protein